MQTFAHLNHLNLRQNLNFESNILSLVLDLKQTIQTQQKMLEYLMSQQQSMDKQILYSQPLNQYSLPEDQKYKEYFQSSHIEPNTFNKEYSSSQNMIKKEENTDDAISYLTTDRSSQVESSPDSSLSRQISPSETANQFEEINKLGEENTGKETSSGIIRRNGFKQPKAPSAESQNQTKRPKNKYITPKSPPSKTKHLWINYGRRILDYALEVTKGDHYWRVRHLVGKVVTKSDFQLVFKVRSGDSEDEKEFKALMTNIALEFIDNKAEEAFQESNYKDGLLSQKEKVAIVIRKFAGIKY